MGKPEEQGQFKATILNVDDDPVCLRATTAGLRREGFLVQEATTGAEALRLVKNAPDLVLLDVHLPDIDGIEVCRRIRSNPCTHAIPVLHISAIHVEAEDRAAGGLAGADMYLTRPVNTELLAATVRVLLRANRAETAARESARQWQEVFDAVSHGVCILDREGLVQRANRALAGLSGRQPQELIGTHYDRLLPGERAPEDHSPFESARASRRHEAAEIRCDNRWFQITADPIADEQGSFDGAVYSLIEISGLKRSEQERKQLVAQLELEQGRLQTILQQMPAGVVIVAAGSGNVVLSNRRADEIVRKPIEVGGAFQGAFSLCVKRPDGQPYAVTDLPEARSLASGEIVTDELIEIVRCDDTRGTISVSSAPIHDHGGKIVAAVVTFFDVTERLELEHQFRQAQKMEAIGRLAGGVAHDFNNLLTIICGYGQMVKQALPKKDPLQRDMEAIIEASERATALTSQLLTFSRRQVIQPKAVDLNQLVTKTNRLLHRVIGEDIEITTTLKPNLPKIKMDPVQVEQVLLNLAVNSRDAMPRGGVLSIETSSARVENPGDGLLPDRTQHSR